MDAKSQGAVVQLVRMPACHAGGRGFESLPHRRKPHKNVGVQQLVRLFFCSANSGFNDKFNKEVGLTLYEECTFHLPREHLQEPDGGVYL